MEHLQEAWLRGPFAGVHPFLMPVLHSFQQAREDLALYTDGLNAGQIWSQPHGFGSVGFHVRHIAGSTRRLMAYLQGSDLTEAELASAQREREPGASREELLNELAAAFRDAESIVRSLDPSELAEVRTVGRKHLPTTAIGLLTHIAEHTQRHVGQAISAAKWAKVAV